MNTTEIGQTAEASVSRFLERKGFKIIGNNWKTPTCEIDIVAQLNNAVYFVEVKYRSSSSQGNGFEYITRQKIKRMSYAARLWTKKYKWNGPVVLSGASVSGPKMNIHFVEQIF